MGIVIMGSSPNATPTNPPVDLNPSLEYRVGALKSTKSAHAGHFVKKVDNTPPYLS